MGRALLAAGVVRGDRASAFAATDFEAPRPGPVSPRSCPACALVVAVLEGAVARRSRALALAGLELAAGHKRLGHPSDRRAP
ncbi:hypothetical protein GCM10010331_03820 [Streptomyces xanthochromogenes]|uniref:hypothetical protein n=1 Tax=Streptomyces xanthochromogenes TaxID=67384 RepID=UPI00167AE93A|nr:hypothetical protein [Streptomyces xanthochromogenes]GHB20954.1 hypothetical protein GCM10010331_03820 [Streptomyces xanthochromogenes]